MNLLNFSAVTSATKKWIAGLMALAILAPGLAGAVTIQDLQQQIAALQAELAQLMGQSPSATAPAACAGITFSRNLRLGMTGSDVRCLQALLNTSTDTQVAISGAGSPNHETAYFGRLTRTAVIKFQEKYAAAILTPWGLTRGTGLVGSTTRAKLNAMLVSPSPSPSPTPTPTPTTPPPTQAGLTVSLASDNPTSTTVVQGQALAHLTNFLFANGDSGSIKVTHLALHRIGVSSDATLPNVYLFNGSTRLTDAASVSSGVITFNDPNGLFTIPANTSLDIGIEADVAGNAGETVGASINSAADISSNASRTNGSFPINGNTMTVASATLSTVNFSSSVTPATATINPQNNYNVWSDTMTVSNHAIQLKRLALREIGTVNYSDLQNFRLYVDGVQQGNAVANLDSNGYVTFDLSGNPVTLQPGSHTITVWADIIGGSSRNFSFSLRTAADVTVTDTQYNANVLATVNSSAFTSVTSGVQSISSGQVVVAKTSDSPSGNIVKGSSGATLARYTLTAAGEPVKISQLRAAAVSSNACTSLSNGALFANGVQVGSTANLNTTNNTTPYTNFNLGSSLVVTPGTPVTLEIRSDINCNDGTHTLATNDTLQAKLVNMSGTSNAQGTVSFTSMDVPTTDVYGNQLTVAQGALTLSQYTAYPSQTMVAPVTNAKLTDFTLTANTTENVNLSSLQVNLTNITSSNVHNLSVAYGTSTSNALATVSSTNNFAINYQLPAGQTIHVQVFGDVASGFTGSNVHFDLIASGTTANSGTFITTNGGTAINGQTLTFVNSGTLSVNLDGSTPLAEITAGNKTINAANFRFSAANDSFTINELQVQLPSSTDSSVIQSASLRDGTTVLATVPYNGSNFDFTGLTVSVPRNSNKTLYVDFALAAPSATNGTDQKNVQATLSYVKYLNSTGVQSTITPSIAGNNIYVYATVPSVTSQALTSNAIINGASTEISRFNVTADPAGPISLKQLEFQNIIATPNAGTPTLSNFRFFRGSQDITSQVTIENATGTDLTGSNTVGVGTNTIVVTFNNGETIAASNSQTYSLQAVPTGFKSTSTSGKDSEATTLLGDSAQNGTNMYVVNSGTGSIVQLAQDNSGTGKTSYNFIWSDNGSVSHSATPGSSSNDWANGYLVSNLPLVSQALSAQ